MRFEGPRHKSATPVAAVLLLLAVPAHGQPVSDSGRPPTIAEGATGTTSADLRLPGVTAQVPAQRNLRLSLDDVVEMALAQNLNIQVQRLAPQIDDTSIALARSAWAPTAFTTFQTNNATNPSTSQLAGGAESITNETFSNALGMTQQLPWLGGSYNVQWNSQNQSSSNVFSTFNPVLRSTVSVGYQQPLLRNFKIDAARQQLLITTNNRDISDVQLRETIVQTVRSVKNAYWNLVAAIAALEVQQQSLELAQESLRNNRTRVEVGTMAPIDIVEAQSEVARNEESVIVAEALIDQTMDTLRALTMDPAETADMWSVRIEPTDAALLQAREIDIEEAVRTALAARTDLRQTRMQLDNTDISIRYYENQRMPDVNLQVNYSTTGVGGTQLIRDSNFGGGVLGSVDTSFGSVLSDVFSNSFPTWTVGVTIGYPLGTSNAEANLARSQLQRTQAQTVIRNLELRIATEVRNVGRQVNTNLKRVDATRAARQLAEQRLEAEQKKFGVGMSTSFLVFQAQRDLAQARNNELSAILDYNRSLVDFEAVQESSLSGGGGAFTLATGGGGGGGGVNVGALTGAQVGGGGGGGGGGGFAP